MKHVPSPAKPKNPYKEGTKRFLVAQRLLAGGGKAKDIGVNVHTVYTVTSDLRAHGYTGIGTGAKPKSNGAGLSSSHSSGPPRTVSRTSRRDGAQGHPSQEDVEKGAKYFLGDGSEGDTSRQSTTRRTSGRRNMSPEDLAQLVNDTVRKNSGESESKSETDIKVNITNY